MKINNVKLKNYRTHENLDIKFSEGINLLLGNNGSGKTSILEAIGIAMFDIGNRSTVKESVKNGEKSASILVEFLGNDGVSYIVERKIGSVSRHRIFEKENPENELTGKKEVIEKVTELCGIKKNSSKIYESVVTVKQNEIVNVFLSKNNEREEVFNEIFDTEIYRKIYKNFSRDILTKYENDSKIIEAKIGEITGMLVDADELKERIKSNNELKLEKENQKTDLLKQLKETEVEKKKFDELKENIKNYNTQINSKKELLGSLKEQTEKININKEIAEESKDILSANQEAFETYKSAYDFLQILRKKLVELDKEKLFKEKLNQRIVQIEKEIISKQNSLENDKKQKKLSEETLENILKNGKMCAQKKEENLEKQKKYNSELAIIDKVLKKLDEEIQLQKELDNQFLLKTNEIDKINNFISEFNEEKLQKELEKLEKTIEILNKEKNEKDELENKKKEILILLDQNQEAKDILSGGICPYLKENCKNISDSNNIDDYFSTKENQLNQEKEKILELLEKYSDLENKEKEILEKKNNFKIELNNFETKKSELKFIEEELKNIELQISNKKYESKEKINPYIQEKELKEYLENSNFKDLFNKLKEKRVTIETDLQYLDLEELDKELQGLRKEYKLKDEELNNLKKNIEKLESEIKTIEIEQDELNKKEAKLNEKLNEYAELKEEEAKTTKILEKVKSSYEIYMQHKTTADSLKTLEEDLIKIQEKRDKTIDEYDELLLKLDSFKEEYDEEKNEKLVESLAKFKVESDNLLKEIYDVDYIIKEDEKELKRYKENKSKIQKLSSENIKLKKKRELTIKFREYINKIGKNISRQMIEKIALLATENFREITGRNEMIKWESNEKESYMLYLVDDESERKFNLLSGGEQVAVALAVRSAMASALSKANFTIFDEPTNNLDEERRKSLADSISKILKGIKQSIIVTHDDTFEEMANKIIKL